MRFGMVIDLQRCVGCGACAYACKAENNTRERGNGQSYNWADFLMKTEGTFPNVTHSVIPVLCNHCSNAPCVEVCPVTPKAMYKTPEGITMHDDATCIGCRACQGALPVQQQRADGREPERRAVQRDQLQPVRRAEPAQVGRQDADDRGPHGRRRRRRRSAPAPRSRR